MAEPALKDEVPEKKRTAKEFAVIRFPGKTRKQDPDEIHVGVNGKKYRMQRNEYLPVPKEVIDVLRNAIEPVAEPDSANGINMRRRKVVTFTPRFPFELLGWIGKSDYVALRDIAKTRTITEDELYEVL